MNENFGRISIHPRRGEKSGRKEVVTDGIIPEKGAAERTPSLSANVDRNQATRSHAPAVTVIRAHSMFTTPGVTVTRTPQ